VPTYANTALPGLKKKTELDGDGLLPCYINVLWRKPNDGDDTDEIYIHGDCHIGVVVISVGCCMSCL
jgi:hypothetical protein